MCIGFFKVLFYGSWSIAEPCSIFMVCINDLFRIIVVSLNLVPILVYMVSGMD
jgi:hypothetical protein